MIDDNLFAKFERIQDPPVSEEMLGAYIEGNLGELDKLSVESSIAFNQELEDLLQAGIEINIYKMSDGHIDDDIDLSSLFLPDVEESLAFADYMEPSSFSFDDSLMELDATCASSNDFSEDSDFNDLNIHNTIEDDDFSDSSEDFDNNSYE